MTNTDVWDSLIEADELAELVDARAALVVDCRFSLTDEHAGRQAYEAGHIPGAIYAHLNSDLSSPVLATTGRHPLPEPTVFAALLGRWGITAETQVVAYDDASGAMAARLWWLLRWMGHPRAAVLNGGLAAWQGRGGDLESGGAGDATVSAAGPYSATRHDDLTISTDAVQAASIGTELCLVDARDTARYAGLSEPLDTAAGHVPGAVNLPFASLLGDDGRFLSAEEIAARWHAVVGERPTDECAVMCGSGVTACHLALAATAAGLGLPRLYAGSWSEWIRDPDRPIETVDAAGGC